MPDQPSSAEIELLLEVAERLGRLTRLEAVKLDAYRIGTLPEKVRTDRHLIAIGLQKNFPIPQACDEQSGSSLQDLLGRKRDGSQVQVLPDDQGVIQAVLSPWNFCSDRGNHRIHKVRPSLGGVLGQLVDGDSGDGVDGIAGVYGIFGLSPTVRPTGVTAPP